MLNARRFAAFIVLAALSALPAAAGAQPYGYAARKPVVAGACATCPWGTIALFLREAMTPAGYDLQVCYSCSGGNNPRIVSEKRVSPAPREGSDLPPSPAGPIDFGVTNLQRLNYAYLGEQDYAKDGPRKNLRAVAVIEHPNYLIVAAKAESFITDLSQIAERKLPVRILTDGSPVSMKALAAYGVTEESLKGWGGQFVSRNSDDRMAFDVMVFGGYLGNTPESDAWYQASQKADLRYLALKPDVIAGLAREFRMEQASIPLGYLRGLDRAIPTVVRSGQAVYGRDDMPEAFAYALAKAIDAEKRRLIWSHIQLSYNPDTAWRSLEIPLHPGAARYYRERGYMK